MQHDLAVRDPTTRDIAEPRLDLDLAERRQACRVLYVARISRLPVHDDDSIDLEPGQVQPPACLADGGDPSTKPGYIWPVA